MSLFKVDEQVKYNALLRDDFIVPPFSILDTRMAYWQDRRKIWLRYTGDLTESRDSDFGRTFNIQKEGLEKRTSTFDPVLAELMYKWFCIPNGYVYDSFGGEQTKGVVAGILGLGYCGMEIRQEQVTINEVVTKQFPKVKYICGNSTNFTNDMQWEMYNKYDMVFTSPPYYDLEVYSDYDSSAKQTYEEFMYDMYRAYNEARNCLKENSFFVIKVGEIRDKNTGEYRNFVADTINQLRKLGLKYYNEIILINSVGSAGMRAAGNMKSRKIVKLHQNILVFYKGDLKAIPNKYKELR